MLFNSSLSSLERIDIILRQASNVFFEIKTTQSKELLYAYQAVIERLEIELHAYLTEDEIKTINTIDTQIKKEFKLEALIFKEKKLRMMAKKKNMLMIEKANTMKWYQFTNNEMKKILDHIKRKHNESNR